MPSGLYWTCKKCSPLFVIMCQLFASVQSALKCPLYTKIGPAACKVKNLAGPS